MEQKNEIRLKRQNDIALLHIKGDITSHSEPFINEAYKKANDQATAGKILIQFDPDAYINSGGIAVLIQILAQTRKMKQKIGITGLSDHFKKIFQMVGISKFADIYSSLPEAIESMSMDS